MNSKHYNPEKLVILREKKYSQKQIAEKLGVTEMTIYRAEKGISVSYELLTAICIELGLDIKKILISTEPKKIYATT